MSDQTRRNFLRNASVGAAAAGAAVVVPSFLPESAGATVPTGAPAHDGPFAVWIKDASTGEIAVMAGEHEIVHRDARLAHQLAALAATAGS